MPATRCVLLGTTASGKTAVSLFLVRAMNAEIISVDSRQIYRGMEIGSAAPTAEEQEQVRHHLIGSESPGTVMSAGEFGRRARKTEAEIVARGKTALLVGGSGLYLRAALGGLDKSLPRDPELRESLRGRIESEGSEVLHQELAKVDPQTASEVAHRDKQRITRALEVIGLTGVRVSELRTQGREVEDSAPIAILDRELEDLEKRMRARIAEMIQTGLEAEARQLLEQDLDPELPALKSVGVAESFQFLRREITRDEWPEAIFLHTRQLAKRQRTWFRGLKKAEWIRVDKAETPARTADRILNLWKIKH